MLIRSSSAPIMKSWVVSHLVELSPESEISRPPHSISLTSPFNSITKITRTHSEDDLRDLCVQKRSQFNQKLNGFVEEEEDHDEQELKVKSRYMSMDPLFCNSGLGGGLVKEEETEEVMEEECLGGGFGSNGRRRLKSGGDRDGDGDGDEEKNDTTDVYYQKMILSDPTNALLLGNYAKFLKEIRGDVVKAEEYFERSILANPNDGNVASLYAGLIWEVYRNASRAAKYFEQAVQAEPENSYVMASYAKFLWDAEEDEEEEEEEEVSESYQSLSRTPDVFQGVSFPSSTSIAAY